MIAGYYYQHENNSIIYKPNCDPADLRESSLVKMYWPLDLADREMAWNLLIEALSNSADSTKLEYLANRWGCDDDDAMIYASLAGISLYMDGDKHCAMQECATNLQEYPAGFGDSYLEAMANLASDMGFRPQKMWGKSFSDFTREV